jgi:hypothetical protein
MPYPDNIQLAREEMLKAEKALMEYLHGPTFDPEKVKTLADAVRISRNKYVEQLHALYPRTHEPRNLSA